jgi:hypothetical protein
MLETGTLTALFRDLVRGAMETLRVASTETTEFYLVRLLETFTRPGKTDLLNPPLAIDYLEAFRLPPSQRYGKLRRVADTSLFVTGMFVDSLERTLVGPQYYAALGRNAYAHLSAGAGPLGASFEELAGRFPEFVRVLAEISEQELFNREQDTVRLYKRWLAHGGTREADLLVRRGLIPVRHGGTEQ